MLLQLRPSFFFFSRSTLDFSRRASLGWGRGNTHSVLGLDERIVDSDNLDVGVLNGVAEDDTANAAETVDANLDGSHCELLVIQDSC